MDVHTEYADGSRVAAKAHGRGDVTANAGGSSPAPQVPEVVPLDVNADNLANNTVEATAPAYGETLDGKPVWLPSGGASVDTGSGVDWVRLSTANEALEVG